MLKFDYDKPPHLHLEHSDLRAHYQTAATRALSSIRRDWRVIAALVALTLLLACAIIPLMPRQYSATALVYPKLYLPRAGQARPDGKRRRGLAGHQRGASDRLRCGPAGGREAPRAASGFRGRRFTVVDVGGSGLDPRHAPSGNPQLFTIRWPGRDVAQQSGGYERHTFIPHRAFLSRRVLPTRRRRSSTPSRSNTSKTRN